MVLSVWIGALVCVLGVMWRVFAARARRDTQESDCRSCRSWDQDAGQRMLRSSPTFAQVMSALSPNDEFGTKEYATDAEGMRYVVRRLPVFTPFEDRWEYFGGCSRDGVLRHRTDRCEHHRRRAVQP